MPSPKRSDRPRLATLAERAASRQTDGPPHPMLPILSGAAVATAPPILFALGVAPDAPWLPIIIASSIVGGVVFTIGALTLPFWLGQRRTGGHAHEPDRDSAG